MHRLHREWREGQEKIPAGRQECSSLQEVGKRGRAMLFPAA